MGRDGRETPRIEGVSLPQRFIRCRESVWGMPRLASILLAGALSVSIVLTLERYVFSDDDDDRAGAASDDATPDPVERTDE